MTSLVPPAIFSDDSGVLRGAAAVNWPKAILIFRRLIGAEATAAAALEELEQLPPGGC